MPLKTLDPIGPRAVGERVNKLDRYSTVQYGSASIFLFEKWVAIETGSGW